MLGLMLPLETSQIARKAFKQALFLKTMLGLAIRTTCFPLQRHTHTYRCETNLPLIFNTRPLSFNTRSLLNENTAPMPMNYSHLGNKTFPAWEHNIPSVGIKSPLLQVYRLCGRYMLSVKGIPELQPYLPYNICVRWALMLTMTSSQNILGISVMPWCVPTTTI